MSDYQLTATDIVIRSSDSAYIPDDQGNRDRVEYNAWLAAGGVPDPYIAPPPPVPESISDRQFFQQLAIEGIITEADALASNAAVIPPPLLAIINQMPTDQQFGVKMLVSGATTFEFSNPVTVAISTAYGWTEAQRAAFFTAAAAL
jgi:hypothetical protein